MAVWKQHTHSQWIGQDRYIAVHMLQEKHTIGDSQAENWCCSTHWYFWNRNICHWSAWDIFYSESFNHHPQSFFVVARKKKLMSHQSALLLQVSTGRQTLVPQQIQDYIADKLYHANIVSVKQELRELGLGTSVITAILLVMGTLII